MSVVLVSDSEVQSNSSNKENVAPDGGEVSAAGPGYSVKNGVCVADDGTMSVQRMIVRGPFVVPIEGPPERDEVKSEVDAGSDDDAMDVKSEQASVLAPSDDSSLEPVLITEEDFPFPNTFSYEVFPLARFAPDGSRLGFNVRSQWQLRVAIWYRVRCNLNPVARG